MHATTSFGLFLARDFRIIDRDTIFTVGHSTRTLDELAAILQAHGVHTLADVRTIPRSRRFPHFNAESLSKTLPERGIRYVPMKALGGLRKPQPDSINAAWRNASFRGYADYMQTPAFDAALHELLETARAAPTAIMCAEAVPWRCHRSLISDALTARGWQVRHLMDQQKSSLHQLNPSAKVQALRVTYPTAGLFDAS